MMMMMMMLMMIILIIVVKQIQIVDLEACLIVNKLNIIGNFDAPNHLTCPCRHNVTWKGKFWVS